MNNKDRLLTCMLTPMSWLYGAATWTRNKLFDSGLLPEEQFDVPVVCVGNLTVGGTGKTPHVEYIVGQLADQYNIAVLSRGYKRHTKGFIVANSKSTPDIIGDEPLQIYQKYGSKVKVAVCESRREGIRRLLDAYPQINLVVLDDAFQHRYVKPRVSVLLMDWQRPVYRDRLLPLGRLRESPSALYRADMVVMTKCPDNMTPLDVRLVRKRLNLLGYQKLFCTRYEYGALLPVFTDENVPRASLEELGSDDAVLLLTGVARPRSFVRHFKHFPFKKKVFHFPDHHDFTRHDIEEIGRRYKALGNGRKLIVTTEKDAVRLMHNPYYPRKLKMVTHYIPIAVNPVQGADDGDFMTVLREAIDRKPHPWDTAKDSQGAATAK